ncbi:MAG TPA: nucleotidyltransferase domain-containing protein [Rectinemataceae bacterium]|nr:nucleotidyltransferase domain-containing protein [Rectinemataceae bacterium]
MSIILSEAESWSVREILVSHLGPVDVRFFGSRAKGGARRFSDLDLAIMAEQPLEPLKRAELREAFSYSDLGFRVDILEWATASSEFRRAVECDLVPL